MTQTDAATVEYPAWPSAASVARRAGLIVAATILILVMLPAALGAAGT